MNKKLTPLEALENLKNLSHDVQYASKIPCIDNELEVIETALKELENIDRVGKMFCIDVDKKLKTFEIIKEKRVDVYHIQATNKVGEYNFWKLSTSKRLKKKEYDLLKEVLL